MDVSFCIIDFYTPTIMFVYYYCTVVLDCKLYLLLSLLTILKVNTLILLYICQHLLDTIVVLTATLSY